MNREKSHSVLGIATAGLALIAFSYFAKPGELSSYGRGVQYDPEGIFVPFGDETFAQRVQGTIPPLPEDPGLDCGAYPDETNDPYLQDQKSLMQDFVIDDEADGQECANPYVGYDYIARRLEETIPKDERRPVTVVIMDSGINGDHEDWCDGQIDGELSKTFLDSVNIHTSPLTDEVGHGTAVGSVAGACTGNAIGIASWGRGIDIASIKLMFPYSGGGIVNPSDLMQAMVYLDEEARLDPERQFVLNMSFAGFGYQETMSDLIARLPENVILIAGAGNNQYGVPHNGLDYPAEYERVYAVGASVDEAPNTLCGFSYYSTDKDRYITAAGCFDIWGFRNLEDGSFPYRDGLAGTSFSAPQLSGMVSYFLHIFPTLPPSEIMQTVYDTSQIVDQSSQGTIEGPLRAISPLRAIHALALKAGYGELIAPPDGMQSVYLPYIER